MAMMPRGVKKDVIYLDPLLFLALLFLGVLPVSLIAVLQQSNALIVAKSALIMVMGVLGLASAILLGSVKQVQIKWIGFNSPIFKIMGLLVLVMLGGTYLSQFLVSASTSVTFGIVDVAQAKLYYGGIGIFEESLFGIGLFLVPNALLDNKYWTAFNFILNPIIFSIYHLAVIPSGVALLYVLIPRILWNVVYLFFAMPSPIMLTHWTWNFVVSSLAAVKLSALALSFSPLVMMLASPALSGPLMVTLNCLPAVGLLAYKAVSSR